VRKTEKINCHGNIKIDIQLLSYRRPCQVQSVSSGVSSEEFERNDIRTRNAQINSKMTAGHRTLREHGRMIVSS
jgi:hypothetical protein